MYLSYNGVQLELLTLDKVERRLVFTPDETTLLYVEWNISCSCVYAPQILDSNGNPQKIGGTSITVTGNEEYLGDNIPPSARGQDPDFGPLTQPGPELAILTDRELRLRLAVPRNQLTIWGYDRTGSPIVWLQSPRNDDQGQPMPRDAKSGPIIQAMPVTAISGSGSLFGVQLEIKTWVTPCPTGSDRLVLAHRWQMTHEHDENYYLTRRVTGEVHFNGGIKDLFEQRADLLVKQQLIHPIPLGFQRSLGPITRSPDGLVVRYSFSDTDQKVVFDPGKTGATHIEIVENFAYRAPWAGLENQLGHQLADDEILAKFNNTMSDWAKMFWKFIRPPI